MVRTQGRDALARPPVASTRQQPVPVEEAGDQIVASDQHQLAHGSDHVGRNAVALAMFSERQTQLAVNPSDPVTGGLRRFDALLLEEQIDEKISRRILSGDQGMVVW
jgi:hypothetical protein